MTTDDFPTGHLIYLLNALAAMDPTYSTSELVAASESADSALTVILSRAKSLGLDTSVIELLTSNNPEVTEAVDDSFLGYLNATDYTDYMLPDGANGWLWMSSIAVDALVMRRSR